MAFWCRINRFKLKHFPNQIAPRHYFGIPNASSLNSNASHTNPSIFEKPYWVIHSGPTSFCNNVRFFAAPVQAAKKEKKDTSGPRLNGKIQAPVIRLVAEEGLKEYFKFEDGKTVVISRSEALECARKLKLDLVEVQRNANPPVCKLMDFHREKYKQQLKEKDRAKSKSEVTLRKGDCKEVRFSGKTELKDLKMKADQIKRLMERGYRVKCRAMGKDQDLSGLLSRLSALIEDVSVVECGPLVRETEAHVVVRHIKFGMSKKGGGKKFKVLGDMSAEVQKATTAQATANSIGPIEELSSTEYDSETEEEILSDEADLPISSSMESQDENLKDNKNAWSVVDSSDNFDEVFHLGDDVNGVISGSTDKRLTTAQESTSPLSSVNVSDLLHPTPVPEFTRANQVPSSPQGPFIRTENRYKGSEPRNQFPPTKPLDNRGPGMRDSVRLEPQFPNQRRQPPVDMNFSPPVAESRQVGTDASVFRNSKLPPNNMPKREPNPPSASSTPASSYGLFSTPIAPGGQGVPAEVRRSREGNPHDSAINPGTIGVSPNKNLPNLNSDDRQRPGPNTGGQKGWGVFSQGNSNAMPSRSSKPN